MNPKCLYGSKACEYPSDRAGIAHMARPTFLDQQNDPDNFHSKSPRRPFGKGAHTSEGHIPNSPTSEGHVPNSPTIKRRSDPVNWCPTATTQESKTHTRGDSEGPLLNCPPSKQGDPTTLPFGRPPESTTQQGTDGESHVHRCSSGPA
jgi:hypothetical protein